MTNTSAQTPGTVQIISVETALQRAEVGELLLVDVRRPSEWNATGVAAPAQAISMHEEGFLEKLDEAMKGDRTQPLGLICAVGGRTGWLSQQLPKYGFTQIYDVSEGMMGSTLGAGWLAKKLPLKTYPPAGEG